MAQILFSANAAILRLEGKGAAEEGYEKYTGTQDNKQRGAVDPLVVSKGLVKVYASPNEAEEQGKTDGKKSGNTLCVILIVLWGHRVYRLTRKRLGHNASVEIKRGLELKASCGNAAYFTGEVWIEPLVATNLVDIKGVRVSFPPGARTAWHTHPAGQILHVVSGRGWAQKEGEVALAMSTGDTVIIGAGEKHWHGAAADSPMAHIAMQPIVDGVDSAWLEQVSDQHYAATGAASTTE